MAKPTASNNLAHDKDEVVVVDDHAPIVLEQASVELDPEELVRVEAVSDGTYPDLIDPRREPYYAIYRNGRVFNGHTGMMSPGEVFLMKRKDALTAIPDERGHGGWVRILKEGELPESMSKEIAPVPSTTAPRGYGQGRRPGLSH